MGERYYEVGLGSYSAEARERELTSKLNNNPVVLQIQCELVDEHRDVTNTAAGEVIGRELEEAAKDARLG